LPRTSLRLVLVAVFALTASALTLPAQPAAAQPAGTQTAELQSPAAFLGYELGEAFTPHHRMVDYVRHVAAASERVQVQQYGTSYEGRPLLLATIGTEENLGRIDEIRQNNLRRTGMLDGEAPADSPAIVWLSYNVHGNESVSTEAALQVLYDFAHPQNERTSGYLQNSVVLLDPCLNPDGRERYVQWYKRTAGAEPNANPAAREHHEPWPGGRTNHYYFDLNRDWAWGVQKETRHRLEVYNRWMPHVHVDFHEMGVDEPYYFAPAARPFHENITDWQREFQFTVGRTNAKYFDQNGWLYFTRQVFDLFYPGYGDTWPIFNGAIGMTYEQGGSGRAGLAVETAEGDTLTLADRIAHHHSTSLSTVEVAATNRQEVVREFGGYYREARQNPPGEYETYVVKRDADGGERLRAFARHLDRQRIRYGVATESASARGRSYRSGETAGVTVEAGDLVVQARQPKARLVKVLMEPQTTIVDSLTYDITAWGLPYAYGLDAYALPDRMTVPTQDSVGTSSGVRGGSAAPYAYLARWTSRADVAFASDLLKHGVSLRFTRREITTGGQTYAPGTVIVTRAGNRDVSGFDDLVRETAQRHEQVLHAVESGFVSEGPDFGSSDLGFVEDPHVAVLAGPPTSSNSLGEVWHFFDRQIDYPLTLLPAEDFDASVLEDVNVLVVPEGRYGEWMTTERTEALAGWVREGGRLVAIGSANGALAGKKPFGLATKSADKKENGDEDGDGGETYGEESGETSADDPLRRYGDRERDRLPEATPGSIHRTRVDTTHPLGFGVSDPYFTLKRSDDAYAYLKDGWNVVALETAEPVSGFMGHEAQDAVGETLVYGAESLGRGRVVYLVDNPLFRGFWYGGQMVFANAVFVVGN
jgi:hypothetical protein